MLHFLYSFPINTKFRYTHPLFHTHGQSIIESVIYHAFGDSFYYYQRMLRILINGKYDTIIDSVDNVLRCRFFLLSLLLPIISVLIRY